MANTHKRNAQQRDWFTGFPEEQSLLLDPPTIAEPLAIASAPAKARNSRARTPGLAAFAVMLHWLVGRVA
jgi:hypothetical protein